MPPQIRASTTSSTASEKRSKCRFGIGTPSSDLPETMSNSTLSLPKKSASAFSDGAAHAAVARRVVGKRRRAERRRRLRRRGEQRLPVRIGHGRRVAVGARLPDRRAGPPEVPVVLVVPAADRRVGRSEVDDRVEARLVGRVEAEPRCELVTGELVPERDRRELPEHRGRGLVRRAGRAVDGTERLHLVEVLLIGTTRERVRPVRPELRRALDEERLLVRDPRVRIGPWIREREGPTHGTPVARVGPDVEREGREVAIVQAEGEHRRCGSGADTDPLGLGRAVGNAGKRRVALGVHGADLSRWHDRDEHVVRCRRDRSGLRPERLGVQRLEVEEVRPVIRLERVHGVVDRALDHCHAAGLPVGRRSDRDGLSLGKGVPLPDHVGACDSRRREDGHEGSAHTQRPASRFGS